MILWRPEDGIVRKGKCTHCGRCCLSRIGICPYLELVVERDLPAGTRIKEIGIGKPIRTECLIFDTDLVVEARGRRCTPETRREFPRTPLDAHSIGCDAFEFFDGKGRKLVVKEIEPRKFAVVVEKS